MSNDHTVPQMYLRRFGWKRRARSREWFVRARAIDDLETPFTPNIARVAAVTDFYGPQVETLLGKIEGAAVPAFDAMLEDPESALPQHWPFDDDHRRKMAWWIAAQIVRTTRQRRRLAHLAATDDGEQLEVSNVLKSLVGRDRHLNFMVEQLARLSWIVYQRPWGLGFSGACLLTGDVPVVVVNGHDDVNQLRAASYWDVLLPLDPHRLLLLPSLSACEKDPHKRVDHRMLFDGGLGIVLNDILLGAADQRVFCHQDHDPFEWGKFYDGPRLATPWNGESVTSSPQYLLQYPTLASRYGVERRWLTEHPPPRGSGPAS
jgi:hypothetical protein